MIAYTLYNTLMDYILLTTSYMVDSLLERDLLMDSRRKKISFSQFSKKIF